MLDIARAGKAFRYDYSFDIDLVHLRGITADELTKRTSQTSLIKAYFKKLNKLLER